MYIKDLGIPMATSFLF